MDLGGLGCFNGLGEGSDGCFAALVSSDPETRNKVYRSGFILDPGDRSVADTGVDWRGLKMPKTPGDNVFSASKPMLPQQSNDLVLRSSGGGGGVFFPDPEPHQQMLCFSSSPKPEAMFVERSSLTGSLPYFLHTPSSGYHGHGTVNINGGGVSSGWRGPFTQSQWMELENQAYFYRYITANMSAPSNLLNPIKRPLESFTFPPPYAGGSLRPSALGWGGAFHLGMSSTDPEPGRCRRTDGKKWRCSRNAVADQKYCERHMNRGRHRSRKPVEGQSGHSAIKTSAAPAVPPPSAVVAVPAGGGLTDLQQVKNSQPLNGRAIFQSEENFGETTVDAAGLFMMKSKPGLFSVPKQNQASCPESSQSLFWPELGQTQLSISLPMASPIFIPPSSSPASCRVTLSPLKLACEVDPIPMGLGVGVHVGHARDWAPASYGEAAVGGPLGEVLHGGATSGGDPGSFRKSLGLNLMMTDGWDGSPRVASSPTGVLHKAPFGSLSNSSAGSSPRLENGKGNGGGRVCSDLLGTALAHSSSQPPL